MAIWIGGEAQRMSGHSSLAWSSTAYVDDQYASILSMNNSKISTTYTDRSAGFSVHDEIDQAKLKKGSNFMFDPKGRYYDVTSAIAKC